MENQTPETETPTGFKGWLKDKAVELGVGIATLGVAVWVAYDNHKRADANRDSYVDYLEIKTDLQQQALDVYKDSLADSDRPQETTKKK